MELKSLSMRENLICYGIPENTTDAADNCETLVRNLIETHLEVTTTDMTFDRAHRLPTRRIPGKKYALLSLSSTTKRIENRSASDHSTRTSGINPGVLIGVGVQQNSITEMRAEPSNQSWIEPSNRRNKYVSFVNYVFTCKFIEDSCAR